MSQHYLFWMPAFSWENVHLVRWSYVFNPVKDVKKTSAEVTDTSPLGNSLADVLCLRRTSIEFSQRVNDEDLTSSVLMIYIPELNVFKTSRQPPLLGKVLCTTHPTPLVTLVERREKLRKHMRVACVQRLSHEVRLPPRLHTQSGTGPFLRTATCGGWTICVKFEYIARTKTCQPINHHPVHVKPAELKSYSLLMQLVTTAAWCMRQNDDRTGSFVTQDIPYVISYAFLVVHFFTSASYTNVPATNVLHVLVNCLYL